jgi:L-fuconolactonase
MLIDAHQHFWQVGANGFEWPTPDLTAIYKNFGPADLHKAAEGLELTGTVLVQSQPSMADTLWLLHLASQTPPVLAVVGWVNLEARDAPAIITALAQHAKLRGLRPMLQNLPDDNWINRRELDAAIDAMVACNLSLDALVLPRHLAALEQCARRHPELRIVIDHGAKPEIARNNYHDWARDIERLAELPQVFCKLSGLPTEMAAEQAHADLKPYIAHLVNCFGAQRLMWGSDWPVVELRMHYRDWLELALSLTGLQGEALEALRHGTATRFYRL